MKIVVDARELRTSTGRYVERLLHYLQQLDDKHDYVVLLKPADYNGWEPSNPRFTKLVCPYKEFTFAEQVGLLRQLNSLKPDLVHFPMAQQPLLYKGRVVTAILDLTTIRFRNPTKNWLVYGLKQRIYKQLVKRVAVKSSRIITISKYVRDDVVAFAGIPKDKITVIYPAADKLNERPEPIPHLADKKFLLYVGRALPHKNLERLIEAFRIVKLQHPELMLVLAGKMDTNYRRVSALASQKRLAHSIWFTDFVNDAELRWLYENATAYVFPSLSEGFGLPGLEAMLYGLPVISSSATCLPEIYGDAAEYFNPKNYRSIAKAVLNVIEHPSRRKQLQHLGFIQVNKYSWRRMAEQTLRVYSEALSENP
jgi:glycosyltransferase involved in cell wall biosynthesis